MKGFKYMLLNPLPSALWGGLWINGIYSLQNYIVS